MENKTSTTIKEIERVYFECKNAFLLGDATKTLEALKKIDWGDIEAQERYIKENDA